MDNTPITATQAADALALIKTFIEETPDESDGIDLKAQRQTASIQLASLMTSSKILTKLRA